MCCARAPFVPSSCCFSKARRVCQSTIAQVSTILNYTSRTADHVRSFRYTARIWLSLKTQSQHLSRVYCGVDYTQPRSWEAQARQLPNVCVGVCVGLKFIYRIFFAVTPVCPIFIVYGGLIEKRCKAYATIRLLPFVLNFLQERNIFEEPVNMSSKKGEIVIRQTVARSYQANP